MSLSQGVAIVLAIGSCAFDIRSRRVPNALTLTSAVAGILFGALTGGWAGAGSSAAGAAVGLAVFLPFFALGGMGGGDVKLMGAIGAWVGPLTALWTGLYGAVAGGVMALALALARGYLRTALTNLKGLVTFWGTVGVRPFEGMTLDTSKGPRLPYVLPITAGLLLALWLR